MTLCLATIVTAISITVINFTQLYALHIPSRHICNRIRAHNRSFQSIIFSTSDEDADFNNRVRLKEEVASPFRKLRYFLYLSMISGGGLGFVTSIPQVIFALQDNDGSISTVATNVAINFGALFGGILLWIREANDEKMKLDRFAKAEKKQNNSLNNNQKSEREVQLAKLPVEIQFSLTDDDTTRVVSFKALQEKGKQNIVVLAGDRPFIRDALISSRLEGNDYFAEQNVIVVPVVFGEEQLESAGNNMGSTGSGKGFGEQKESLMTAPYIAKPAQVCYALFLFLANCTRYIIPFVLCITDHIRSMYGCETFKRRLMLL
jgi:hypothetical protein